MGPKSGQGCVVMFSGGVDSTALVEYAAASGELLGTVFVDYGQPAVDQERDVVRWWHALHERFYRHVELRVDLHNMVEMRTPSDPGFRVVPARNAVFAMMGVNYATSIGAHAVWLGATKDDAVDYVDCEHQSALLLSRASCYMCGVHVVYPLHDMTKSEVYGMLSKYGIAADKTWSCYEPTAEGVPCEVCKACRARMIGRFCPRGE